MNRKLLVFIVGIFVLSVIFGSVLPLFLNSSDRTLVSEYLDNFISNVGNINYLSFLLNGLISNCGFLVILWLLGVSIIGGVIALILFFAKGFILGFSICSIIINYGLNGILFSFFYLFPHQIINVCIYGLITCYSLIFSFKFLCFLFKKYEFNVRVAFGKYFKVFCFSLCVLVISVLYEAFVWPRLMVFICNWLGL